MSARVRFGVTTMATDPPQRFRELVGLIEAAGFATVRELAERVLPHVASA